MKSVEINFDFFSFEEWSQWKSANQIYFDEWRHSIIDWITRNGFEEPITKIKRLPAEIICRHENLRESLSACELNSRKRAGLYVMEDLAKKSGWHLKILGAEGVSRTARILRGHFPFYLGCEYLPTTEEKEKYFPIPHLDILNIAYKNESFHVFFSSDVFEHVPSLQVSLDEIYKVLKNGGVLVSVFPFYEDRMETTVCAKIADDLSIEYLCSPEYHHNPISPSSGSLVYNKSGWDILKMCQNSGFDKCKMKFVASSKFGITSSMSPGVFVLYAYKSLGPKLFQNIFYENNRLKYSGSSLSKVVAILALPRSGTTILTSVLSVHSDVFAVFEPWNSKQWPDLNENDWSLQDVVNSMSSKESDKSVLLVKETTTKEIYISNIAKLLRSVQFPIEREFVVIFRNPFHVFLSEVQARKEWWSEEDLEVTTNVFESWIDKSIISYKKLCLLCEEFNATIISYEYAMENDNAVEKLMELIGMNYEIKQSSYYDYIDRSIVRGDISVFNSPKPMSVVSVNKRENERVQLDALFSKSIKYNLLKNVEFIIEKICRNKIVKSSEVLNDLKIIQAL